MASPPITSHAYIASHPDLRNPSSSTSPVPSLYSSLSSLRTTNPSAYHANAKWWSSTLHDWAWKGVQSQASSSSSSPPARLVFTVDATLVDAFTLNDDAARPTAIPTAIAAMIKAGELVPLKAFLAAKDPIRKGARTPISSSSSSSASSLIPTPRQVLSFTVARPFWFAMRMAGLSSNEDDDDNHAAGQYDEDEDWPRVTGSWVSLPNLDKATSLVLSSASAQVPSSCPLLSMQAFRAPVRQALPHLEAEVDYEVLLKHLARDKRVAIVEGQVVKLAAEGDVQPITEEERSIFAVRETHARLAVQVADIEKRIGERTEEVKGILKTTTGSAQVSSSSNPRIRHLLSSRRALNDLLTRRLASLSQLEGVLLRIEQASDDVTLLSAYEAADQALRGLHKQSGGADRAEEVMARLEESVADQRDVEEAMRLGGVGVNGGEGEVDEEELQREMERLELEEKEEKEQRRLQQQQAEAPKAKVGAAQPAAAAARPEDADAAASQQSTTPQQQPQADKPAAAASQDASPDKATSTQQQQQQQRQPVLNE